MDGAGSEVPAAIPSSFPMTAVVAEQMDAAGGPANGLHSPASYAPGPAPEEPPPKRRRGRPPRKDQQQQQGAAGEQPQQPKRRGRPPGTKNKTGSGTFTQIMTINSGEDVVEKLKAFAAAHKKSVCILAACGSLSTATLMQVGQGGQGVGVTLRGQFTVLSISGAILEEVNEEATGEPKTFLSASLANPTGGVVGGTVAGVLKANGVVTLVICTWDPKSQQGRTSAASSGLQVAGTPLMTTPMFQSPSLAGVDPSVTADHSGVAAPTPLQPPAGQQQVLNPAEVVVSPVIPASLPLAAKLPNTDAPMPTEDGSQAPCADTTENAEARGLEAAQEGRTVTAEGAV
ncbi:unnamed protein product [Ostreobium quekettii]|uniref:AT-hook motif nuclear-localized protein n=1 Tax=Ostreobium quekettii TaxID=121088 RepID=A0A8S1IU74_9CHLO|nr:unnamed protein product [Ostreobium quekettii]|eukprot:evm.model.scf_589.3 EVM.evm.TU.scf_589.3   scf_589:10853-13955(-)